MTPEVELHLIKSHLLRDSDIILGYEVREKARDEKTSAKDNSKWLIVYYRDAVGNLFFNRVSHNNNQKMRVDRESFFNNGYEHMKGMAP